MNNAARQYYCRTCIVCGVAKEPTAFYDHKHCHECVARRPPKAPNPYTPDVLHIALAHAVQTHGIGGASAEFVLSAAGLYADFLTNGPKPVEGGAE